MGSTLWDLHVRLATMCTAKCALVSNMPYVASINYDLLVFIYRSTLVSCIGLEPKADDALLGKPSCSLVEYSQAVSWNRCWPGSPDCGDRAFAVCMVCHAILAGPPQASREQAFSRLEHMLVTCQLSCKPLQWMPPGFYDDLLLLNSQILTYVCCR